MSLGTPFMPWQEYVADVALEIDPTTGLPAYREIWITIPRQSGKTTWVLCICVHRAIGWGQRQLIVYAAQTRNDAAKKWEDDHLPILEASPLSRMMRVRRGNGKEAFIWRNGSMHSITSNTEKAGHGPTLDLGVIDEAFAQEDDRLEQAMKPSMVTRPAAQLLGTSTAGWKRKSKYLHGKVLTGRRLVEHDSTSGIAYFEWSAPEEWDPEDPATWRACMPALGYTISEATIAADLATMRESEEGLLGFRRAYLNQWVDKTATTPTISPYSWKRITDRGSQITGPLAFAVDTTPERDHTAIGVYGKRADKLGHVEVVDSRPGTIWVVPRVVELVRRWHPTAVVIDPAAAAGSFITALEHEGITVTKTSARDLAQGSGNIYSMIQDQTLRHRDQASLNAAAQGAQKRNLADAWAWDRRNSADNISPLVAVTLAMHGYEATVAQAPYDPLASVI